jgi:hypothetical protein
MFKKTLVASALALAAFGSQAAVVAITATTVSQEGAVGQASVVVPNAVVTLGAEYTVNDSVTFTISGAEFDTTASVPLLVGALYGADGALGGGDDDTVTFGLLNMTANTVTFRITAQTDGAADGVNYTDYDGAGPAVDGFFTLSGMQMKTSTVTDAVGDIKVAYSAITNNQQALDSAGTLSAVAQTVVAQFASTTTLALNGVIDVENDRQQFTVVAPDSALTDSLTITPTDATPTTHAGVYNGAVIKIHGDFSWMETDGDAGIDAAELAAAFGVVAGGADTYTSVINAAGDQITVTVADAGGNTVEAATLQFTVAGLGDDSATLSVQDFTVDTTINYTTPAAVASTKATQTASSAGSWTLNGAQAIYNYVPVGYSGVQDTILLSNKGVKDGGVVIEGFDEAGHTYAPVNVGTLMAGTNMTITDANLKTWLGVVGAAKLSVTITVNAPDNDVDFSGYTQKAGTGRQLMAVKYL